MRIKNWDWDWELKNWDWDWDWEWEWEIEKLRIKNWGYFFSLRVLFLIYLDFIFYYFSLPTSDHLTLLLRPYYNFFLINFSLLIINYSLLIIPYYLFLISLQSKTRLRYLFSFYIFHGHIFLGCRGWFVNQLDQICIERFHCHICFFLWQHFLIFVCKSTSW